VDLNVWKGSDYLLLWREVGALLELKVAYRAGQREVTVNTAKVDKAACCLDTCLLGWGLLALLLVGLLLAYLRSAACGRTREAWPGP